jgi:L-fuculose-phosphate aldolase
MQNMGTTFAKFKIYGFGYQSNSNICCQSQEKIAKRTVKALKGRNAALMANHGAVCVGRDLDEAFVVSQVLEKSCKAFIEAEFLGGAKSINKFEAYLMHQFYLKKYSKKAKTNKEN